MKKPATSQQNMFGAEEFKKKFTANKKIKEENVQIAICEYLRRKYPKVIFTCDLASGMKLPLHIAAKNKKMRSSRGLPDLFIASVKLRGAGDFMDPKMIPVHFGLFLEIKRASCRLKSGGVAKSEHHAEQEEILRRLRQLGYKAEFACGFEEAVNLIDEYMQ